MTLINSDQQADLEVAYGMTAYSQWTDEPTEEHPEGVQHAAVNLVPNAEQLAALVASCAGAAQAADGS